MKKSIGKLTDNDIVIANDPTISRKHAELIFEDNEAFIRDLGSLNGTYVNGKRIIRKKKLNQLDIIKIGNSILNWTDYLSDSNDNTILFSDSKTIIQDQEKQIIDYEQGSGWEGITSFVCGILGFIVFAAIFGPLAIIFGALGLKKKYKGLAISGLVLGIIDTVIIFLFFIA